MLSSIHIFDWYLFLPIYTQIAYKISILWRFSNKRHLCEFVCGGTVGLFDLAIALWDIARGKRRKNAWEFFVLQGLYVHKQGAKNVPFGTELTWTKVFDRTLAGSTQHILQMAHFWIKLWNSQFHCIATGYWPFFLALAFCSGFVKVIRAQPLCLGCLPFDAFTAFTHYIKPCRSMNELQIHIFLKTEGTDWCVSSWFGCFFL